MLRIREEAIQNLGTMPEYWNWQALSTIFQTGEHGEVIRS
ncbi:MAG: hypothetical protein BMS9Abin36_0381 [Gammaproteobacteria bacterium]|nr:MAG: hypothetical protein BMS9Abin36_0381 [Gammaproteobacteria bacterium]